MLFYKIWKIDKTCCFIAYKDNVKISVSKARTEGLYFTHIVQNTEIDSSSVLERCHGHPYIKIDHVTQWQALLSCTYYNTIIYFLKNKKNNRI